MGTPSGLFPHSLRPIDRTTGMRIAIHALSILQLVRCCERGYRHTRSRPATVAGELNSYKFVGLSIDEYTLGKYVDECRVAVIAGTQKTQILQSHENKTKI